MDVVLPRPDLHRVRRRHHLIFLRIVLHRAGPQLHELGEPLIAKCVLQGIQGNRSRICQVQDLGKQENVVGCEVIQLKLQVKIWRMAAHRLPCAQRGHLHLRAKEPLQTPDLSRVIGVGDIEGVLVVHVVDQRAGHIFLHQPRQHHTGEEALAGAGSPKNAAGALHQPPQVQLHRVGLFDGVADDEVAGEEQLYVLWLGQAGHGVVRRHSFDRLWANAPLFHLLLPVQVAGGIFLWVGAAVHHQRGVDVQRGIERLAQEQLAQRGLQANRLLVGEARVGGAQLQVGDQAEITPVAAVTDHEAAFLHLICGYRQAHVEPFAQPTAADKADHFLPFAHTIAPGAFSCTPCDPAFCSWVATSDTVSAFCAIRRMAS